MTVSQGRRGLHYRSCSFLVCPILLKNSWVPGPDRARGTHRLHASGVPLRSATIFVKKRLKKLARECVCHASSLPPCNRRWLKMDYYYPGAGARAGAPGAPGARRKSAGARLRTLSACVSHVCAYACVRVCSSFRACVRTIGGRCTWEECTSPLRVAHSGFRAALMDAVLQASQRSAELATKKA